jgi:hypothetical protein
MLASGGLLVAIGCGGHGAGDQTCPAVMPTDGASCDLANPSSPPGAVGVCGYTTDTNPCGAVNCYCMQGAWGCNPTCIVFDGGGPEASGDGGGGDDGDATTSDSPADAPEPLDTGDVLAYPPMCTSPLPDAGFTSFAELPLAALCASARGQVFEGEPPCQGSIVVFVSGGIDCSGFYLFDADTGALEATGGGCNGTEVCGGGVAGFQFPYQCFYNGGWPQETNLCADGGNDAATTDAPTSD